MTVEQQQMFLFIGEDYSRDRAELRMNTEQKFPIESFPLKEHPQHESSSFAERELDALSGQRNPLLRHLVPFTQHTEQTDQSLIQNFPNPSQCSTSLRTPMSISPQLLQKAGSASTNFTECMNLTSQEPTELLLRGLSQNAGVPVQEVTISCFDRCQNEFLESQQLHNVPEARMNSGTSRVNPQNARKNLKNTASPIEYQATSEELMAAREILQLQSKKRPAFFDLNPNEFDPPIKNYLITMINRTSPETMQAEVDKRLNAPRYEWLSYLFNGPDNFKARTALEQSKKEVQALQEEIVNYRAKLEALEKEKSLLADQLSEYWSVVQNNFQMQDSAVLYESLEEDLKRKSSRITRSTRSNTAQSNALSLSSKTKCNRTTPPMLGKGSDIKEDAVKKYLEALITDKSANQSIDGPISQPTPDDQEAAAFLFSSSQQSAADAQVAQQVLYALAEELPVQHNPDSIPSPLLPLKDETSSQSTVTLHQQLEILIK